jgi:tetratricopeptide (TPR) repeat protein
MRARTTPTPADLSRWLAAAGQARQRGELAIAEAQYRSVLAAQPGNPQALAALAGLYHQAGRLQDAIRVLSTPQATSPELKANLGVLLMSAGRIDQALECLDAAVAALPTHPVVHCNRGHALRQLQRLPEALAAYERAISLQPDNVDALDSAGVVLDALGRYDEALARHDQALALAPGFPRALHNRGVLLLRLRRHQEAATVLTEALRRQPEFPEALNHRAVAYTKLKQPHLALADLERALVLRPGFAEARGNRGIALVDLHRPDEGLADIDDALAALPESPLYLGARATALLRLGRIEEGRQAAARASELEPGIPQHRWHLALAQLALGDYAEGWRNYETRWQLDDWPARRLSDAPIWQGQVSLEGKSVLVQSEQGLGDTIHFSRFVLPLVKQGAAVTLQVQAPLVSVMATLDPGCAVISEKDEPPAHDYVCPLLSLPLALGLRADSIPAPIPYLHAVPERASLWAGLVAPWRRPRIGLVVSGNIDYGNDCNRSMPLAALAPLLDLPAEFVLLQKEIRDSDRPFLAEHPRIRQVADLLGDFADTAALLSHLDLVLAVDTSVAHLAGALGRPLWLLFAHVPEWRWLMGRLPCPWYPQARIFAQTAQGDWSGVVARVRDALAEALAVGPRGFAGCTAAAARDRSTGCQ